MYTHTPHTTGQYFHTPHTTTRQDGACVRVSTPSEEVRGNCAIARPHSRLARGAMVPDALSFSVSPMSGPSRGGTSLGVRLVSSEGAGASLSMAVAIATTTLHIGDVALNCTESGDSSLRCCCTPRAANLPRPAVCLPKRQRKCMSSYAYVIIAIQRGLLGLALGLNGAIRRVYAGY